MLVRLPATINHHHPWPSVGTTFATSYYFASINRFTAKPTKIITGNRNCKLPHLEQGFINLTSFKQQNSRLFIFFTLGSSNRCRLQSRRVLMFSFRNKEPTTPSTPVINFALTANRHLKTPRLARLSSGRQPITPRGLPHWRRLS